MMSNVLRVALCVGALIDGVVAIFALFLPQLMGPLFDIPLRDPAVTTIAGGEFLVAAFIYVVLLRDLERFRPLLWLVALDQTLAAVLPGLEIARGHIAATFKTLAPMPINAALVVVYVLAARKPQ
jgi:hypothetical protein